MPRTRIQSAATRRRIIWGIVREERETIRTTQNNTIRRSYGGQWRRLRRH